MNTVHSNGADKTNVNALLEEIEVALVNVRTDLVQSGDKSLGGKSTEGLRVAEQALLRSMDWLRCIHSTPSGYSK